MTDRVYTRTLNRWLTDSWILPLAWVVPVTEIVLDGARFAGVGRRVVATLSGVPLLCFGIGMTIGTGVKTALDASVFAAAAPAFLLSLDASA